MFAINISYFEASVIKTLPSNTVLISINEEYENYRPLMLDRNDERVLSLRFTDIICDVEQFGKVYHTLNQEMAKTITNFIEKHKDCNFIIHCRAGVSRSSAVAMYIHLKYGHSLKENFWIISNPNTQVLGMLIREGYRKGILCF